MAANPAIKAGERWMSVGGNSDDPRTLILGDCNLRPAAANPESFGIHPEDQVAAIWLGKLKEAKASFGFPRSHILKNITNIVFLGFGTNDLSHEGPGGIQIPGSTASKFLDEFRSLIDLLHSQYPNATIVTTDPIPRRTSGYCNAEIEYVRGKVSQCFDGHHHVNYARKYWWKTGRILKDNFFDAEGKNLKSEEIKTMIEAVYRALNLLRTEPGPAAKKKLGMIPFTFKF
jgi:hypothetical protein